MKLFQSQRYLVTEQHKRLHRLEGAANIVPCAEQGEPGSKGACRKDQLGDNKSMYAVIPRSEGSHYLTGTSSR